MLEDEQTDYKRVARDLEMTRKAWRSEVGRRSRIYQYLQAVFDIGQSWRREGKGIRFQSFMLKIANFNMGERQPGRFRVIVYCSSDPKSEF